MKWSGQCWALTPTQTQCRTFVTVGPTQTDKKRTKAPSVSVGPVGPLELLRQHKHACPNRQKLISRICPHIFSIYARTILPSDKIEAHKSSRNSKHKCPRVKESGRGKCEMIGLFRNAQQERKRHDSIFQKIGQSWL